MVPSDEYEATPVMPLTIYVKFVPEKVKNVTPPYFHEPWKLGPVPPVGITVVVVVTVVGVTVVATIVVVITDVVAVTVVVGNIIVGILLVLILTAS